METNCPEKSSVDLSLIDDRAKQILLTQKVQIISILNSERKIDFENTIDRLANFEGPVTLGCYINGTYFKVMAFKQSITSGKSLDVLKTYGIFELENIEEINNVGGVPIGELMFDIDIGLEQFVLIGSIKNFSDIKKFNFWVKACREKRAPRVSIMSEQRIIKDGMDIKSLKMKPEEIRIPVRYQGKYFDKSNMIVGNISNSGIQIFVQKTRHIEAFKEFVGLFNKQHLNGIPISIEIGNRILNIFVQKIRLKELFFGNGIQGAEIYSIGFKIVSISDNDKSYLGLMIDRLIDRVQGIITGKYDCRLTSEKCSLAKSCHQCEDLEKRNYERTILVPDDFLYENGMGFRLDGYRSSIYPIEASVRASKDIPILIKGAIKDISLGGFQIVIDLYDEKGRLRIGFKEYLNSIQSDMVLMVYGDNGSLEERPILFKFGFEDLSVNYKVRNRYFFDTKNRRPVYCVQCFVLDSYLPQYQNAVTRYLQSLGETH